MYNFPKVLIGASCIIKCVSNKPLKGEAAIDTQALSAQQTKDDFVPEVKL